MSWRKIGKNKYKMEVERQVDGERKRKSKTYKTELKGRDLTRFMQAKENDVVLVAGKGHEDYQIVGSQRLDYSDRVTAARLLGVIA